MLFLYFLGLCLTFFCTSFSSVVLTLGTSLSLSVSLDFSALVFLATLVNVSVSVLLFSYYYLESTFSYRCFLSIVLCFLGSMFGLVLAGDLLTLLVFWDLLGFTSFFLVIYYRSRTALAGGILTGLTNRLGDCFFLLFFGTVLYFGTTPPSVCCYVLLLVSMTKSAQVPFSAWLPAAMSAPTPVSAIVHSSTLVTAGVYLLYRFVLLPTFVILVIGIFTSLLAGATALCEQDVKKIIALSTLRQLGVMVSSIGLGARGFSFLHLNLHAFYKALLFVVIGIVIHSQYGSQEVRALGSLAGLSSLSLIILSLARFSLCGITFMSGWVSKEAILRVFYNSSSSLILLFLYYVGIALTLSYSTRLVLLAARGSCFLPQVLVAPLLPSVVKFPLLFLALLSVLEGRLLSPRLGLNFTCIEYWEALFLFVIIGLGARLGTLTLSKSYLVFPFFLYLKGSSSVMRSGRVGIGTLLHTESPSMFFGITPAFFGFLPKSVGAYEVVRPQLLFLFFLFCFFV